MAGASRGFWLQLVIMNLQTCQKQYGEEEIIRKLHVVFTVAVRTDFQQRVQPSLHRGVERFLESHTGNKPSGLLDPPGLQRCVPALSQDARNISRQHSMNESHLSACKLCHIYVQEQIAS